MTIALPGTVAERIATALVRHGVGFIFAQSLPSAVILAAEDAGIRQIAYRQENMGGAMADGYARLSGRVGVVAAQNGPAATLLVPPLAEALKASVPIVAIVQEVERDQSDRNAFQEMDQIALFQACTKWVRRVVVAGRVDDYVDAAFTAAASGRPGPAVLLVPADLLREPAPLPKFARRATLGHWPLDRFRASDDLIEEAASGLAAARSPVVLAGGGVHSSQATKALAILQEDAHLPVFTTNMGKGAVDEFHPLSGGVLGPLVGPLSIGLYGKELLNAADLVLLVGTRTNQNGTDGWRLIPPTANIIHIDADPSEIGRTYEALRLVGDAAETLTALHQALKKRDLSSRLGRRAELEASIATAWARFDSDCAPLVARTSGPIRPERIMFELQSRLNPQMTVVADASYSSMWMAAYLRSAAPGMRFVAPRGLAGLGWGLPLALGSKAARPNSPTIAIVGDGGFAHSWAELETMVRSDLAVIVIVLNNGLLGYQKHAELVKFGRYSSACYFGPTDHIKIAEACGCAAERVVEPDEVGPALDRALGRGGPVLLEVMVDPDAFPPLSVLADLDLAGIEA